MKASLTAMGQLEITGEISDGLSWYSLPPVRVENCDWKLNVVYLYKVKCPKYLKEHEASVIEELEQIMKKFCGRKFAINGEVGNFFVENGAFVFFVRDHPHNWTTGNEFRKLIETAFRRVKKPYYMAWKENVKQRRLTHRVSYVKASQDTDSST